MRNLGLPSGSALPAGKPWTRWSRGFAVAALALAATLWARSAHALTVEVPTREPSLVGEPFVFRAVVTDTPQGVVQFRWDFGDGTRTELTPGLSEVEHTYSAPGHYPARLLAQDDAGFATVSVPHTVHYPLPATKPTTSSDIVYDEVRNLVYNVNQDNDTLSAIDANTLEKVGELAVYQRPEALAIAPDGKLWVLHRDDYAVAVVDLDSFAIERGFQLPYASQPLGLAMSPLGDAAYVTLTALGKLLKLDPMTGQILSETPIGSFARGVSVSHDGARVYVTRFISAGPNGEVVEVEAASMSVTRRLVLPEDTTTDDTDQQGRGQPNYLFSVGLSPDGLQAWVPAKKDNIGRGFVRDGQELTQDNTVRPMISVLDLGSGTEVLERRMDLDDRNLPSHVVFSPLGDYVFVSVTGSNLVEVRDAYTSGFLTAMRNIGLGPRGAVLTPDGKLFVHASLTRSVVVLDVSEMLTSLDFISKLVAEIPVVESEKLSPEVLRGKQVFLDSEDQRMTVQGYLSCATCHFDGFEDGRVYDFTDQGEGLRNTVSLLGRRGMGHGPSRWSGNFDEVQDFENEIRDLFNGTGFIPDEVFLQGTHANPLGDPKAGLDADLDALAAYVSSLDQVNPSPYKNSDGTHTEAGLAGRLVFEKLGCDFCHVGPDLTDSERGKLHDVGTLEASSGTRAGGPLLGIDTPTLLGVWETAPYLHDGSAATLRDVLTTENPGDAHGFVSSLSSEEIDQLVAYLLELDGDPDVRRPPFGGNAGAGGTGGSGAGGKGAGGTDAGGTGAGASGGGGCAVGPRSKVEWNPLVFLALLSVWHIRRAPSKVRRFSWPATKRQRVGRSTTQRSGSPNA